ncbi:hypothetical protein [Methanosarcina sp. DH2]|nr:hypothetical protein [Methanosarcina sp. DH2]
MSDAPSFWGVEGAPVKVKSLILSALLRTKQEWSVRNGALGMER